jgi:hypothetical protein
MKSPSFDPASIGDAQPGSSEPPLMTLRSLLREAAAWLDIVAAIGM